MKEIPGDRAQYLRNSPELDTLYRKAALCGSSEPPAAESEMGYHYICLMRRSGCLYELDGDRTGPIYRCNLEDDEDALSEKGCNILKMYMDSYPAGSFSLLALRNLFSTTLRNECCT
jgi:ubiquitin carboxyl-terminal hydrolase L3